MPTAAWIGSKSVARNVVPLDSQEGRPAFLAVEHVRCFDRACAGDDKQGSESGHRDVRDEARDGHQDHRYPYSR